MTPTIPADADYPSEALVDYSRYREHGGRFSFVVWWERYQNDYPTEGSA